MQSLKATALEPTRAEMSSMGTSERLFRLAAIYGLPILTVMLVIAFSLALPRTYPTLLNARSILSNQSITALLALAAMVPMMAGRIDLTVGYGIVLWHILAISLQTIYGVPWVMACIIVLIGGGLLGFLNGILVEFAQIDSFIATLGTGTITYAVALWHTGGQQVTGNFSQGFLDISGVWIFGFPIAAIYVLALAILLWLASERMPIGRYIYAIGASPKAAALNGLQVRKYVIGTFITSGLITAFAGIVLASKLEIGQATVGLNFLLPALVGAFLGTTTIKPGRVNVWGTVVGVLILGVGISGIQQLGGSYYVEPLFNGITLIIAIGIAAYTQRRGASKRA